MIVFGICRFLQLNKIKKQIMKNKIIYPALLLIALTLFSCQKQNTTNLIKGNAPSATAKVKKGGISASGSFLGNYGGQLCNSMSVDLIAGQNQLAGTVTVSFDWLHTYVTYQTTGNYTISQIHLYIGDLAGVPLANGNPSPGQFANGGMYNNATCVTYVFNSADVPSYFCVAAHAVVSGSPSGSGYQTNTGWGAGLPFSGCNWATYFCTYKQGCGE